ncbi:1-phosphofructokinase [Mesoplasma florum L1]|uniref:1-phosphofructokinase n=1 Tax=Mesoplasma florum (strain ATCC 33453 / NBRC 100688 / NCTC 11704 / L1) TaxID=265311 RepID=Q6F1T6_MESFL|nr:1-phosphofructokinase [Mesoplasma florum]AAT75537.1 1-phosphofructokinase [Mesoplasma florum L1]
MIYTVTLNPALDHIIETDGFNIGETNYYKNEYVVIGGKGINVSIILNNLEAKVLSTGILGSNNKNSFLEKFDENNLKNKFFINKGVTRTNLKIKNLSKFEETELNGLGSTVSLEIINELKTFLNDNLKSGDILVAAGSIPAGVKNNIYEEIGNIANEKNALFILDTSKVNMLNGLKTKPYLIKPNIEEICEILNLPFKEYTFEETCEMVKKLKSLGARNVLLSRGSKGSYFFSEKGEIFETGIAKGKLVNSVGSGDSMIAGFTYGLYKNLSIEECLQFGAAAGGATAFTEWLGLKEDILKLKQEIKVNKIK